MEGAAGGTDRYGREQRRRAILEAALGVFVEKGYAGATVDDVIERAGGSKRTIYDYFGGKEGLFGAVMTENLERTLGPSPTEGLEASDLEGTLADFGRRYLAVLMTPTAVGLFRVAVGEGARFPALAQAFYDSGAGLASSKLAELLTAFEQSGELEAGQARTVAERFCGAVRDDAHLKVVLGLRDPPDDEEAAAAVRRTVEIFVSGIA